MDSQGFDRITRRWASSTPRRTLLSALVAGAIGLASSPQATAKKQKKKKVTLCLNGQTVSVKKSQKGKLLKQGATPGACTASPPASPPPSPPASPPGPPPPPSATCSDGIKNNGESSIDCGGPNCPACGNGRNCDRNVDCLSGNCNFDFNSCEVCREDNDCSSDFNGSCLCSVNAGECFSNIEPRHFVNSCDECHPELACVLFIAGFACMPRCDSSEICGTADLCRGGSTGCGHGGFCMQPLGGGPTRCGGTTGKCICASHQECIDLFGERAFCVQFNPDIGVCTCGPGVTTFCAVAV